MKFDYEISRQEIQELSSSDAIAAFFSKLGYRTDSRTAQAPANLGITANGTLRPIKKTELIADQEGLLQVYLFELTSVTVSHTRSLCRAFRNRAGNFLLILTSDYERLDFVLLEKYIPSSSKSGKTISLSQVNVHPRTLTVNRKKPETVHLRVLRRFTYTESDPFAQYDKLLCAYAIADWSEEYFNNRALFSDHCLLERLRERPEWQEDPKPTYQALRELYVSASSRFANKPETDVRKELYEPAFKKLGFDFKVGKKSNSSMHEPDYYLLQKGKKETIGVCLTYTWGRSLDSKDDQRDQETSEENPGAVVVSLLERGLALWAIVTNGRIWRLYSQKTHSRATNYYEIDLEEILAQGGPLANDPAEAFRFFWLLFRCEAFVAKAIQRDGKEQQLCFLDELLSDSETYAKELGDRLKDRVFGRIFPQLSEGFIKYIRARDGKQADLSQERLDQVFTGTLMFLYRLLFLLYAESRGLLPVKEVRGFFEASIEKIKRETADIAGKIEDEVEKGLKKHFKDNEYVLYDRLLRLFEVIDRGDSDLNVPVYNGGLFITHPDEDDLTDDAHNARFLHNNKIPDRFLARAVDLLARDIDTKRQDLVFVDYKSLGVRQLGSIYEGLLEFKLRVAPEKMAIVKGKKTEEVVPYREAIEKKRKILTKGRGRNTPERILAKGEVYLENDKRERKATGSYYTPDYIVDYIVDHTVGPVLQEKFEALRPRLRQAQKERQEFFKKQEALKKKGIKPEPESKVNLIGQELVKDVFDIKVLDPAMGSGHFLVEAVDYITDKTIDFLNAFPWNPVTVYLNQMRETILSEMDEQGISIDRNRLTDVNLLKRHVLKRSVYGVDINPMAVELAKVSLWLDCFTLGAPLSFLDHHLHCGNSLIGTTVEEVDKATESTKKTSLLLSGDRFAGLMMATELMRHIGELSDVTTAQVRESQREYRKASDALLPFKRKLDLYTSRWFGNTPIKRVTQKKGRGRERITETRDVTVEVICSSDVDPTLKASPQDIEQAIAKLPKDDQNIIHTAVNAASKHRFFHWELEFPEVFYDDGHKKKAAGFDAIIGNPPYDVLSGRELGYDISSELSYYESLPIFSPAIRGKKNLYKLFICRSIAVLASKGYFSFIVPMALLGDDQAAGIRLMLLNRTNLVTTEAFPQKDDPDNRVFPEAKLSTCIFVTHYESNDAQFTVRAHPGRLIEPSIDPLRLYPSEILGFDPEKAIIPSCTQRDWDICVKIISLPEIRRLGDCCRASQGEINETTDGKRGFISSNPKNGPQILRGATICLYALREQSQGEAIYLREQKYLKGKPNSVKARHHEQARIAWQESSPQNNFRRIIVAPVPKGKFCNHTINYIPESDTILTSDFLLLLLNSKVSDWLFRLGSSNAHVSHYQIYGLPCPAFVDHPTVYWSELFAKQDWKGLTALLYASCTKPGTMPLHTVEALTEMSRHIQEIEAKRVLKARSERSQLAPESQPLQDVIDIVLFRCYGLTDDVGAYIEKRLKEML